MSLLFLPLKILLVALDFMIMAITFGWVKSASKIFAPKPLRSKQVGDDHSHRVALSYSDDLKTDGSKTMYDVNVRSFKKYASSKCAISREYLGMHKENPPVRKFGASKSRTYEDMGIEAHKFGSALRKSGLVSAPDVATIDAITTPCSLAIYENTCPEWMIAAMGSFSQSFIVTTIYATLGFSAVVDAIQAGDISAILCNKRNVEKLVEKIKDMPTLKIIIYTSDYVAADENIELPAVPSGVQIISYDDFVASGDTVAFPPVPPKPTSCAVVMYTSGSTGKAKGVILKHYGLVAACYSFTEQIKIRTDDIYVGYLPLAHIFELSVEFAVFASGGSVSYACPKTLTQKGAYPTGALEHYCPSLLIGVPKVWDIIKKGAEAKIAASKPIAKFLVETAFQARKFAHQCGWETPLFNALVFKKFSNIVGGNLRMAGSGGGPLNSEVQSFVRTAFGCSMNQGYGLTETCSSLSMQCSDDLTPEVVGPPTNCVQVKLKSTPDITDKAGVPYLSTDKHDVEGNVIFGRGEVLVKGKNLLVGYYRMPEETKKAFDGDYFCTGDVGQFMEDGSLRIVDRVKNLVKLKSAEYIAIERMEMCYSNCKYVDAAQGGIMCYGDGDMDRPIALMHLNETLAMEWASANGISGNFETVKKSKEMHLEVISAMKIEWKKAGLSHLEKLVSLEFLDDVWTPENGCLTAANKLQRKAVITKFEKEFNATKAKGIF
eukprot:CAMPEP_0197831352 /NCGR_PEP_ID=MMETSP1437-20131217/9543_1 /TAXON_ID=49252 ORGANISM="Eucampia antarctica, Strain CCMP1452" /NCGR_SAMPLE_ID=MMETSP1437 /ASSEMBLY_ACC=CAM_ASM_001096 /LENGTH=716 /DNA_ID=CAMNT_0043434229 /DNA_START=107 /DNA_END=2257 /DNA_ORIENTATION=-